MENKTNITPEGIFKKHYKKKTGKDADNIVMYYMGYCFDSMNEFADLKCAPLIKRIEKLEFKNKKLKYVYDLSNKEFEITMKNYDALQNAANKIASTLETILKNKGKYPLDYEKIKTKLDNYKKLIN